MDDVEVIIDFYFRKGFIDKATTYMLLVRLLLLLPRGQSRLISINLEVIN